MNDSEVRTRVSWFAASWDGDEDTQWMRHLGAFFRGCTTDEVDHAYHELRDITPTRPSVLEVMHRVEQVRSRGAAVPAVAGERARARGVLLARRVLATLRKEAVSA